MQFDSSTHQETQRFGASKLGMKFLDLDPNSDSDFFIQHMYIMKFYRPVHVSMKITKIHHRLVDFENQHKYIISKFYINLVQLNWTFLQFFNDTYIPLMKNILCGSMLYCWHCHMNNVHFVFLEALYLGNTASYIWQAKHCGSGPDQK